MHLHYLTLRRQVEFLSAHLQDGKISASYTQTKNEQILDIVLPQGQVRQLRLSADANYPYILSREPGKRAKNSTDVLASLIGKQIQSISIRPGDRVISFHFKNSDIRFVVQLFRNNSNFFIVDEKGFIREAFKKKKKYSGQPYQPKSSGLIDPEEIKPDEFIQIIKNMDDAPLSYVLKIKFLYLTSTLVHEILYRCGLKPETFTRKLSTEQLLMVFQEIQTLVKACQEDAPRVYLNSDFPERFVLTEFKTLQHLPARTFLEINEALAFFIFRRRRVENFQNKIDRISKLLDEKIEHVDHLIQHLKNLPAESDKSQRYRKIADLLMSQLNQIPEGREEVELVDYFDPQQKKIRVRLNRNLTIVENAQKYYEKAKVSVHRQAELKIRLEQLAKQKTLLHHLKNQLTEVKKEKGLDKIEKKLTSIHILQPSSTRLPDFSVPYKQYFYQDWEIWVGKNARSNDEMTFKLAHKEDFWLHAQGVSGSHVIIRNPKRDKQLPKDILEYAAALAAFNSQARHSSYVPVMVTQVKYVRKPKGSIPGAVIPERTKTIFIEPLCQKK